MDNYITVYTRDGDCCECLARDEPGLDAAVTRYATERRNELLELTTISGAMYKVLASEVTSWIESTSETRERARELQKERQAEEPVQHPWETD